MYRYDMGRQASRNTSQHLATHLLLLIAATVLAIWLIVASNFFKRKSEDTRVDYRLLAAGVVLLAVVFLIAGSGYATVVALPSF